jgi:hypothetical protein
MSAKEACFGQLLEAVFRLEAYRNLSGHESADV